MISKPQSDILFLFPELSLISTSLEEALFIKCCLIGFAWQPCEKGFPTSIHIS